jgi:hypothetical protein
VLRVSNVLWVPELGGVFSQSQILRRRVTIYCFEMDKCCLCPDDLASDQQWFLELGRETYIG